MAVFVLLLQSCVHDELYSASDPTSKEYHSKSLWKEDKKYIKNVMKVYLENESEIKKTSGTPYWDYATTVNNFDESFLMVPVVEGKTVVSILKVPKHGSKIYFYYTNSNEELEFFQGLVFSKYKKPLKSDDVSETNKITCNRQWISIWVPDNNNNPDGPGHWDTRSVIRCRQEIDQCVGVVNEFGQCEGGGGSNPGYPYPGGGGPSEPETPNQDIINNLQGYPCAQGIAQQLPTLQNDLAASMRQVFQNNKNYNITFKPKSGLGDIDGETSSAYNAEFDKFNAVINLNDEVLLNATKEYILVTMYHEVIHAFLRAEKVRLGDVAFHEQYPSVIVGYDYAPNGTIINRFTFMPNHQQLMPFLTTLKNIISSYNPNLPSNVVTAMAKAGITTMTPEESELNNNERNTLLGKQKGTKCQ
jgi:hypothetical protein